MKWPLIASLAFAWFSGLITGLAMHPRSVPIFIESAHCETVRADAMKEAARRCAAIIEERRL